MADKRQPIYGMGTGSRFARGLQVATDYIEALPEKASEAQKKFHADFVAKFNSDSDFRVKTIYTDRGVTVKLPENDAKPSK